MNSVELRCETSVKDSRGSSEPRRKGRDFYLPLGCQALVVLIVVSVTDRCVTSSADDVKLCSSALHLS
jgi:hypothetical protein